MNRLHTRSSAANRFQTLGRVVLLALCGCGGGGGSGDGASGAPGSPRLQSVGGALPDARVATDYRLTFPADGAQPLTWAVSAGRLPSGLSLDAESGTLVGVPSREEYVEFTVRVSNAAGRAEVDCRMQVEPAPSGAPEITTRRLSDAAIGIEYVAQLEATGSVPLTWSVSSGVLPTGITLGATTGVLAGTPTGEGVAEFTVVAQNAAGSDLETLRLTVAPAPEPPAILDPGAAIPGATLDAPYFHLFAATGTAPLEWRVAAGALPTGIELVPELGLLIGLPTVTGSSSFTIEVENAAGSDSSAYVLDVDRNPTLVEITPSTAVRGGGLRIVGSGFSNEPTDHTVTVGGVAARVLESDPTELLVEVPAGVAVGARDVEVSVSGEVSDPLGVTIAADSVRFVNAAVASGGARDGSSWADAFDDLQAALAVALPGDRIWVAAGTYLPGSDRDATFLLVADTTVLGGFAGTEGAEEQADALAYRSVLSGDLDGDDVGFWGNEDNAWHVATAAGGDCGLDGLTIEAGHAVAPAPTTAGGALLVSGGVVTMRRVRVTTNESERGAVAVTGGRLEASDCVFSGNRVSGIGGALHVAATATDGSSLQRCVFAENSATAGGAIASEGSDWSLADCVFVANEVLQAGGALHLSGADGEVSVSSCTFSGNTAIEAGAIEHASTGSGPLQVVDCILWGNFAVTAPAIRTASSVVIQSSILTAGLGAIALVGSASVDDRGGNRDVDPQFVDSGSARGADGLYATRDDGLMPEPTSPAIDLGTRTGAGLSDVTGTARPQGAASDVGAYEAAPSGG